MARVRAGGAEGRNMLPCDGHARCKKNSGDFPVTDPEVTARASRCRVVLRTGMTASGRPNETVANLPLHRHGRPGSLDMAVSRLC